MSVLRLGVAGLGTVGDATVALLQQQRELIAERCGRPVEVVAVSARDKAKKRVANYDAIRWVQDPLDLARDPSVDAVVELIGGVDVAKTLCEAALQSGKHVVTANKALIAQHGTALAGLAETRKRLLAFEAAVAGGIPIIHALRNGLAANRFRRIAGILNGTCNFILTKMEQEGMDYADALAEAQRLGYAEADPTIDVDGTDTAHKLAILARIGFNGRIPFASVRVEGIQSVSARDIASAKSCIWRIVVPATWPFLQKSCLPKLGDDCFRILNIIVST